MKTLQLLTALGFLAATAGFAQTVNVAKVPFEFQAGASKLPAGEYRVQRGVVPGAIVVVTADKAHTIAVQSGTPKEVKESRSMLVFHKYGSQYILAEVWFADERIARPLKTGRIERELQAAATTAKPETVYLAANTSR